MDRCLLYEWSKTIDGLMSKLIDEQMDKMYKHFKKITGEKKMIKEDVKQVVKFVNAKVEPMKMWGVAKEAAVDAVDTYMEGKEEPMYCGFANISIRPAQGKFVGWLKKQGIGSNGYRGGWRVSYYDIMPENHQYRHCQSLDIKEVACDAFAKVLEEQYGLNVMSESRAD